MNGCYNNYSGVNLKKVLTLKSRATAQSVGILSILSSCIQTSPVDELSMASSCIHTSRIDEVYHVNPCIQLYLLDELLHFI